jgi:ketosteroid isomerase-like protein
MTAITWSGPETTHPARTASRRSMDAVTRGAKEEWLALFAEDGVVEDPVGVSMFDPTGRGHHGRAGIGKFWALAIANVERFEFVMRDSFAAGDEVANVGTITAFLPGGSRVDTEGVFVYKVNAEGLIVSMRAFWEIERAMATLRQTEEHVHDLPGGQG